MMNTRNTAMQTMAERLKTNPVTYNRTMRPDIVRTINSSQPGKAVPLAFIPLLREDGLESSRVNLTAYMAETTNLIINTVHCVFTAYLVPKMAFDRFDESLDALNRSYLGQPEKDGTTIPWVDTHPGGDATTYNEFYKTAGLHSGNSADLVNTDYWEAYAKVFEYRCRQRSESLWEAVKDDFAVGTLFPAFFDNPQMGIVKPSFDDQMLDGEVPLTFTGASERLPLASSMTINDPIATANSPAALSGDWTQGADGFWRAAADIFSEMDAEGITVSIANIDLAREMQSWARVRAQYSGLDDDQLIDLLMAGVSIPTLHQARPMLLGRAKVPFGMSQRYATDSANLDVSATRGVASTSMTLRAPQVNTGGVIVIQAEVVPEQFWERAKDYHLMSNNDTRRPDRLLDQLDPQAVEIVENNHADVKHTDPTGVFGYAPLNHGYVRRRFNVGGKFWKSDPLGAWFEDRNRIWASEPVDPTLSKELFLATDLPQEVFMDQNVDNIEYSLAGDFKVSGLTYVGPLLREMVGQYDAISERVDKTRIAGTPVNELPATADTNDDDCEEEVVETTPTEESEES